MLKDMPVQQLYRPLQPINLPLPQSEALTQREYQILLLANQGLSYAQVALSLGISVHTVRTHVKHSYVKLQVNSKTQALYQLKRLGKSLS